MTSAVPASCRLVTGSSSSQLPRNKVETGPTIPVCAAGPAPMRATASMVMKTGRTVQSVAFRADNCHTTGVCANRVANGRSRPYCSRAATLEAVIASACLPLAFPAVEIEGENYWDGGYSANPPLVQLVQESGNHDLVLVTVNPINRRRTPSSPDRIPDRISELTFNQTLTKDIRAIALLKAELDGRPPVCGVPFIQSIANLRLHEIQNEIAMREFDPKSKMFPSWSLLTDLHGLGSDTASEWLATHRKSLGVTGTAKLEERYL